MRTAQPRFESRKLSLRIEMKRQHIYKLTSNLHVYCMLGKTDTYQTYKDLVQKSMLAPYHIPELCDAKKFRYRESNPALVGG